MKFSIEDKLTPPDYEFLEANQKIINKNAVVAALKADDKNLNRKIHTFTESYDYDINAVKEKIENDEMFAATFSILPIKQVFHQKIASEYIKKLPMVKNFRLLPVHGKGAWYVGALGDIVKKEILPKNFSLTKSLDFSWNLSSYKCFASHKYTRGHGGSQDNQYKDIKVTLENYQKGGAEEDNILFIICDGPYYKDNDNKKKKELIKSTRLRKPKSYVVTINEIHEVLKNIANE